MISWSKPTSKKFTGRAIFFLQLGLRVFCGLEMDYFPGVETEAERIRNMFEFDFVIGSVHCLDDIAISDKREAPSYFLKNTLSRMADDYFGLLREAAQVSSFDCLGHVDYYIRYGRPYYGDELDRIEAERFDEAFDLLKKGERGIEINTSPFRFGMRKFHPSQEIIERAIEKGVRIVSIGSDTHKPETLSLGVLEAYELIEKHNLQPLFPKSP
jgi:histidinol-phosphatase (PHP family)